VAEILAEDCRALLVARPANLRKWFATRLGRAKVKPGVRPPTDLTPVAHALRFVRTSSAFGQRRAYERLMAVRFPGQKRRDLKPAVYLRLDVRERFPRVTLTPHGAGQADCFGPFRDRPSAEKAVHALHKLYPLRPCDYHFEPDPEWPTGVGCLFAQVKSCAAPCLVRVTEEAYRRVAQEAARFLGEPGTRPADAEAWVRPFVTQADTRALVVEPTRSGFELYPITGGSVGEGTTATKDTLDAAVGALRWEAGPDDAPWLTSWIYEKKRGHYLLAGEGLLDAVRALMGA
jgi:hypothetical protein